MIGRYGQLMHFIPVLAPADITTSATNTNAVDLARCHRATFFVNFGAVSSTSLDQSVVVTVLASSVVTSGTGTAIAFNYRLSGAIGTDSWGAITAATSSGYAPAAAATIENTTLLIDVDPAVALAGPGSLDGRYVRVVITPTAGAVHVLVGALAELEPRYAQTSMESAS
jgi:hypothetical protein